VDPTDPSYYAELTKFEMAELALMLHSTRLEQVSVLIALFSAYLATAYLVATKLTRFQLWAITILYSALVLVTTAGYIGLSSQASALALQRSGVDQISLFIGIGATFILAWILSLAFMWHSRHGGKD
jgi:hypothetical protein